jgi:heme-degrading monooxygenase HmoA
MPEHVILWEFLVRPGWEAEFESAYGPEGAWVRLFAQGDGYLGSELLRNTSVPRRYTTIDRWRSADDFAHFRDAHAAQYAALDSRCEAWTEAETSIGTWNPA